MLRSSYDKNYFTSPIYKIDLISKSKEKSEIIEDHIDGENVLEIGCGTGEILSKLSNNLNKLGIDIAEEAIKKATYKYPDIDFRKADVENIEIKDKYDAVIALDVFEHLHHPLKTLNKMSRLLKKGGKFIISVPNNFGIGKYIFVPIMNFFDRTHVNTLHRKTWIKLFNKTGFGIHKTYNKLATGFSQRKVAAGLATSVMWVLIKK